MSDLVKRLRDKRKTVAWFPESAEAADRIDQLEREVSRLIDAFANNDKRLREQLTTEKALADQLHEVAYACVSWENPARAAYRKSRGL